MPIQGRATTLVHLQCYNRTHPPSYHECAKSWDNSQGDIFLYLFHFLPAPTTLRAMICRNLCASAGCKPVHYLFHLQLFNFSRNLHKMLCFKLALSRHVYLYIQISLIQPFELLQTRRTSHHHVELTLISPIGNQFFPLPLQTTQAPLCQPPAPPKKCCKKHCQHANLNNLLSFIFQATLSGS